MQLRVDYDGTEVSLSAERVDGEWRVLLPNAAVYQISITPPSNEAVNFLVRSGGATASSSVDRMLRVARVSTDRDVVLAWEGEVFRFTRAGETTASGQHDVNRRDASGVVVAPGGGMIVDVSVVEGQDVEAYQQIAVIEAMKVMTTVEAPCDGRVRKLFVLRGQRVEQGAPVAQIERVNMDSPNPGGE